MNNMNQFDPQFAPIDGVGNDQTVQALRSETVYEPYNPAIYNPTQDAFNMGAQGYGIYSQFATPTAGAVGAGGAGGVNAGMGSATMASNAEIAASLYGSGAGAGTAGAGTAGAGTATATVGAEGAGGTALASNPVGWIAAAILAQNVLHNKDISTWQDGIKGRAGMKTGDHFLDQWGVDDDSVGYDALGTLGIGSGGGVLNPAWAVDKVWGLFD